MLLQILGNMLCNFLVLVGLGYLLSRLEAVRGGFRRIGRGSAFGLAMGGIAAILMAASFYGQDGLLFDLRDVVLVLSGFLGGPVAALMTMAVTGFVQLALDYGDHSLAVFSIAVAAGIGLAAYAIGARTSIRNLALIGVALAAFRAAAVMLSYRLGWSSAAEPAAILMVLPLSLAFLPFSVVSMGVLLRFERTRARQATSLQSENRTLARRDARFRAIFHGSSVAMILMDKDGRILDANQRMADLVGYSRAEMRARRYEDLLLPEDREDYFRIRAEQAQSGRAPKDSERRYLRKDGHVIWGLRSTTLIPSSQSSEPLFKFVIIQDITARRLGEEKIRFQAELLQSVEEAAIATDLGGHVIFWNRYAEKLCGIASQDALGKDVSSVLPSVREQFDARRMRDTLQAGGSWSGELIVTRPEGTPILAKFRSAPVKDAAGTVVAIITVATDITEERHSRIALIEEQRTLAILNRTAAQLNVELDLTALMRIVTDAGVDITGAEFCALYSSREAGDGAFALYSVSGIARESFEALALPDVATLLEPVLASHALMRSDDIWSDARFAGLEQADGSQHLRSCLVAPLKSRAGDVTGALLLGHAKAAVFAERSEKVIEGIAAHAAIAIERASLFSAARQEIETRKRAEESLNKSEARFREFAEVGSDLLWETDALFRITSIVGDARSVFGMPDDELIGRTAWQVAKADIHAPEWKQHILDHETHQPFRNFEYQIVDRNGATRWITTNGRPYFDRHGAFLGFRGASTNIAARKHAEAKLAASARQQQSAAVLSQLALQGVPREDLYQVAVELVARTLGVELVGILELSADKRILRLKAGSGWPAQSVNIRAVPLDYCPPLARGINSDVPVHFSRRNFNLIQGLQNDKGSGVVLPIGEKAVRIGALVVCSDGFRAFSETDINFLRAISFVLAADAEQRKTESTLKLRDRALEAIGDGIMITEATEFDNPLIYVNPAFERLTGYAKEEAIGRNARFLQGAETDPNTLERLRRAVEEETTFRGSILNYRKDGTSFWNGLTLSPIRDTQGSTSHFVGILSDETEQVALAAQLRQAQKMEALGHLTGGVAHDFNNLLAVILGNSEILHDEIEDPDLKSTAELVMTTAEKGADLTQRLLAFGRRQALHPEALRLGDIIASLSDMFVRTLGTHITLEARATTEKLAYVDRNLFESAVLNLVLNARDAMPNGGVVTIETVALESADDIPGDLRNGDYVHVCVRDTGVGMAKDVLDRAFDPFFTTKGLGKGTGMGLSMVYGFAKQSGGHVSIDSKPGQGTAVHLYLPIARDEVIAKPIEAPKERPPEGGHEKILVVEDEPHVRQFVTMQLNGLGYSVLEAEAGAAALEILRGEPAIDLLFTDLLMPGGMSGFDLVERARALCPDLKVLLTTGYAAEADSMLADVKDPILKKPYKKQQLAEALRTVLEQAA